MKCKYDIVMFDTITSQSFVDWTYEDNNNTQGREGLLNLHLASALRVGEENKPIIHLTSITRKEIEERYSPTDTCNAGVLIEASGEFYIPESLTEEEAILKTASLLIWKKENFCILTGNSLLFDKAKKLGFEVFMIHEAETLFQQSNKNNT